MEKEEGWKQQNKIPSLQENYKTIAISKQWPWWKKMFGFAGPGYLIAVGYMDPGNWATSIAGGSAFGYSLLSIILLSNLMAIVLQSLACKLGIVTGRDLAQACRDHYSKPINILLWILCESAICACDLAEVIGSAIALNLLFNIPLLYGVLITALDVLAIIYFQKWSFRFLEVFVIALILLITATFWFEIKISHPDMNEVLKGFIPQIELFTNSEMLFIGIGIIGATVMPHNLYLHSSIVQTRGYEETLAGKKEAIKYTTWDSTIALTLALFVNGAILIVAAAVFYSSGHTEIAEIQDAYRLLTPILNEPMASTLFAFALLACGQNSTLTGTLAGQIAMQGFLNIRLKPWLRRLITRGVAIIPALLCILIYGEKNIGKLLLLSQVVLSFQLGFAIIPLITFTGDRKKMGPFVNRLWLKILAWGSALLIIGLNIKYLASNM